ncbi:MAG: SpoIID/LytB domain-containing protein, partial [Myxococcota bacterium]
RVGELEVAGRLQVIPVSGQIAVIGHVPLDDYVEGALSGEIPALWAEEALRAQAVVSRTYALHERAAHASDPYDVAATTANQVYKGGGVAESIHRAVRDTGCQVLTFRGEPILAVFHSAAGGMTASAAEVWGRDLTYLVSQEVQGEDDSPDTYWRASVSGTTLQRALAASGHRLGPLREMRVTARWDSGRVRSLQITGTRGQAELSGRRLRSVVGTGVLKSTLFEVRADQDGGFVFVGSGRGHGVGMSQWGARAMAVRGVSYPHILSNFYPGTRLEKWDTRELSARGVGAPPR